MSYPFLRVLLAEAEAFEAAQPPTATPTLAAFSRWLAASAESAIAAPEPATPTLPAPPVTPITPEIRRLPPSEHGSQDAEIATFLTFLSRYVRSYVRLGLENSPLTTFDDFTYLATLLRSEPAPLTKSQLTEQNIQEKATGTEIIRRLLKRGFIAEEPHPTDKRAKQLRLTPTGRGILFASFERMSHVAALGAGNLTDPEKNTLLVLLRKLDHFHHPLFVAGAGRGEPIEALVARHLPAAASSE